MILVFDTETTGLPLHPHSKDEVQPRIIEWGGVLATPEGEVVEELVVLVNPQQKLEAKITQITGLTDEDLADQPLFAERAPEIRPMFERASMMVAHNLPFDWTLMELEAARNGLDWPQPSGLCTVQEHAEEWGRRPRLLELYEWYFGEPLEQTHRALDDVKALLRICVAAGVLR